MGDEIGSTNHKRTAIGCILAAWALLIGVLICVGRVACFQDGMDLADREKMFKGETFQYCTWYMTFGTNNDPMIRYKLWPILMLSSMLAIWVPGLILICISSFVNAGGRDGGMKSKTAYNIANAGGWLATIGGFLFTIISSLVWGKSIWMRDAMGELTPYAILNTEAARSAMTREVVLHTFFFFLIPVSISFLGGTARSSAMKHWQKINEMEHPPRVEAPRAEPQIIYVQGPPPQQPYGAPPQNCESQQYAQQPEFQAKVNIV